MRPRGCLLLNHRLIIPTITTMAEKKLSLKCQGHGEGHIRYILCESLFLRKHTNLSGTSTRPRDNCFAWRFRRESTKRKINKGLSRFFSSLIKQERRHCLHCRTKFSWSGSNWNRDGDIFQSSGWPQVTHKYLCWVSTWGHSSLLCWENLLAM